MNRIKQTFAAPHNEGLLTGSSPGYKPVRKLEDCFAPSPQAIASE
jgi:hypothetical protein